VKYLIAGLGNIGDKYINTRHNVGFVILNALAQQESVTFSSDRYADVARFKHRGKQIILIKPSTYMNLSGKAVKYWMQHEKIDIENILVVVDDVALDLGTIRFKPKGGDGGHNGLTDIIVSLTSTDFARLRFGIGSGFAKGYQVDYVLGSWSGEEEKILVPRIKTAAEAIKHFAAHGLQNTMNTYNTKIASP